MLISKPTQGTLPIYTAKESFDRFSIVVLMIMTVYKFAFLPTALAQSVRCGAIALLIIICFRSISRVPGIGWVFQFAVVITGCTVFAGGGPQNALYAAILGLNVVALFLGFAQLKEKYGLFGALSSLFWPLLLVCLANDFVVFAAHINNSLSSYLIGNKFSTGDIHSLLIVVYGTLLAERHGYVVYNWGIFWIFVVETILVLIKASAMTALLGFLLAVAVVVVIPSKVKSFCSRGVVFIGVLAIANIVFFCSGMMLQNPYVQSFIQDVLGRSLTMTGRTPIYDRLGFIIGASPYVGYGYGNTIVERVVGWGNAQNGVAEIVVMYGLVGLVSFGLMVHGVLGEKGERNEKALSLIGVLYGMILTSLVEVSFGIAFYFALAIVSVSLSASCRQVRSDCTDCISKFDDPRFARRM